MNLTHLLKISTFNKLAFLAIIALFISCSKGDDNGEPEPAATKPGNLLYSPASLNLNAGSAGTSAKPTVSGTAPIIYSVSTSPTSNGAITIDSEGKIKAATTLSAGTYVVSVTATNAAGSTNFNNVYTITVTSASTAAPQNLAYSPNSLTTTQGAAATSAAPSITSTGAVTYTASSVPASTAISINNQGVISASNTLATGTYLVSVTASNSGGSTTFNNVYTIQVNNQSGTAVTYSTVQSIIANNCSSCHFSGGQTNFGSYTAAKNNIDAILNRIKLPQGAAGMMPNGGTRLPQATIDQVQKWKDDGLMQ